MIKTMKKIFFAFLILFSVAGIFAAEDVSDSTLNVGIAFPYMKHDYKINGEDSIKLFGTGIDFNYRRRNSGYSFGFFMDANIFFPLYKTVNLSDKTTASKNLSDYEYFFGVDALAGVYKVVFSSKDITVPAGIGIHLDGYTSKLSENSYSIKESAYTMGIGGWTNYEINLSDNVGVFAGIKVIYDFYYKMKNTGVSSGSSSGKCDAWSFVPTVGAAIRF